MDDFSRAYTDSAPDDGIKLDWVKVDWSHMPRNESMHCSPIRAILVAAIDDEWEKWAVSATTTRDTLI